MKKRKVVLSEELFDKYQDRYYEASCENRDLREENGYLKALFDKEGDTEVIKYGGKLYRIAHTTYCKVVDGEETIDFTAVPVSEVG